MTDSTRTSSARKFCSQRSPEADPYYNRIGIFERRVAGKEVDQDSLDPDHLIHGERTAHGTWTYRYSSGAVTTITITHW